MKTETLEEYIDDLLKDYSDIDKAKYGLLIRVGVKWQTKRSYSKEDMIEAFDSGTVNQLNFTNKKPYQNAIEWFEEFIKRNNRI